MRKVDDVVPDQDVVGQCSPIAQVFFKTGAAQAFRPVFFNGAEHDIHVGLRFGERGCGARVLVRKCRDDLIGEALGDFIDKAQHGARLAMF